MRFYVRALMRLAILEPNTGDAAPPVLPFQIESKVGRVKWRRNAALG
jgi:hypothetical protein